MSINQLVDKLHKPSNKDANRDVAKSAEVWRNGLAEERRIKMFLLSLGFHVTNSSKEENIWDDIDCWIGTTSVSIKAQHSSLNYPGITACFELEQCLTGTDTWETSWFYNGKADKYLILQGTTLSLIDSKALKEQVERQGFSYTRTNKTATRAYSGGSSRYQDARCGYIPQAELPVEKQWVLPRDWGK